MSIFHCTNTGTPTGSHVVMINYLVEALSQSLRVKMSRRNLSSNVFLPTQMTPQDKGNLVNN